MKLSKSIYFICLLATLFPLKIEKIYDKFEEKTVYRTEDIFLRKEEKKWKVHFFDAVVIQKTVTDTKKTSFELVYKYAGQNQLNIPKGRTLVLLTDKEKMVLSGDGSESFRSQTWGGFSETCYYKITTNQIKKICEALRVDVKVDNSRKIFHTNSFSRSAMNDFREFYRIHVDDFSKLNIPEEPKKTKIPGPKKEYYEGDIRLLEFSSIREIMTNEFLTWDQKIWLSNDFELKLWREERRKKRDARRKK